MRPDPITLTDSEAFTRAPINVNSLEKFEWFGLIFS